MYDRSGFRASLGFPRLALREIFAPAFLPMMRRPRTPPILFPWSLPLMPWTLVLMPWSRRSWSASNRTAFDAARWTREQLLPLLRP